MHSGTDRGRLVGRIGAQRKWLEAVGGAHSRSRALRILRMCAAIERDLNSSNLFWFPYTALYIAVGPGWLAAPEQNQVPL